MDFSWTQSYELFCFDFDGLLVNTELLHFKAYRQTLLEYDLDLPWSFLDYCLEAHVSKESLKNAVYSLFPVLQELEPDWEVIRAKKNQLYQGFLSGSDLELMPGVSDLLPYLANAKKKMCVVTNAYQSQVSAIRERLPMLDIIPTWFTRESYDKAKPSPDGYLTALKHFSKDPKEAIGFEDSLKGLKAIHAAKMHGLLICPKEQAVTPVDFDYQQFDSLLEITFSNTH